MKRKRYLVLGLTLVILSMLSACAAKETAPPTQPATTDTTITTAAETTAAEEEIMNQITITVGDREYTATLYDNAAAQAFANRLPLTMTMEELNGNEKYAYLDSALPTNASVPDGIETGDLKLFGSDCLVLFYDSFATSYSYTDIGKIDNPDELKETLGSGDVVVTFAITKA